MLLDWEIFKGPIAFPVKIEGDPDVRPTRRWNAYFLRRLAWKSVIFEVEPGWALRGYRIGFWPVGTIQAKLSRQVLNDQRLALRIGHEACRFFITLDDGKPIPAPAIHTIGTVGREIPLY